MAKEPKSESEDSDFDPYFEVKPIQKPSDGADSSESEGREKEAYVAKLAMSGQPFVFKSAPPIPNKIQPSAYEKFDGDQVTLLSHHEILNLTPRDGSHNPSSGGPRFMDPDFISNNRLLRDIEER